MFLLIIVCSITSSAEYNGDTSHQDYWLEYIRLYRQGGEEWEQFYYNKVSSTDNCYLFEYYDENIAMYQRKENFAIKINYEFKPNEAVKNTEAYTDIFSIRIITEKGIEYKTYYHLDEKNIYTFAEMCKDSGFDGKDKIFLLQIKCLDFYHRISEPILYEVKTGWNKIEGNDVYIKANGTVITQNAIINGKRYTFYSNGICKGPYTGWTKSSNGKRYWVNGNLIKNKWLKNSKGERFYASENGIIITGEAEIKKKIYVFDSKGKLIEGPFELCHIIVEHFKSGSIELYESWSNGKTWVNNIIPPIYAFAKDPLLSIDDPSVDFTVINNLSDTIEGSSAGTIKGLTSNNRIAEILDSTNIKSGDSYNIRHLLQNYNNISHNQEFSLNVKYHTKSSKWISSYQRFDDEYVIKIEMSFR